MEREIIRDMSKEKKSPPPLVNHRWNAPSLSQEGLTLIPIDINVRQRMEALVLVGNGVDFPFEKKSVVMICRPCHGPTTEFYIKNAIRRSVCEVLYVGKPSNFKNDCGRYHRQFKRTMTNAGKEYESVYLLEVE